MNIEGQFLLFIGLALIVAWGIWRISIHSQEHEEEERKVEEENEKKKEYLRCQLKDDISELANKQEKILDKWKRSAYCARSNNKAEPKNKTETCDEDADKKAD